MSGWLAGQAGQVDLVGRVDSPNRLWAFTGFLRPFSSVASIRVERKKGGHTSGWWLTCRIISDPGYGRRILSLCLAAKPEPLKSCIIWHNLHPICKPTGSTHPSPQGVVQVLRAAVCPFGLSRHHRQPQSHCRPLALRWSVGGQL